MKNGRTFQGATLFLAAVIGGFILGGFCVYFGLRVVALGAA